MVERDLAKVEVASSTLVSRSILSVGSSQFAVGGARFNCHLPIANCLLHFAAA